MSLSKAKPGSKDRILAAARKQLLSTGVERLSLREVAREAGFSPSSLYEHFAGKADLVAALMRQASDLLFEAMAKAAKAADPRRALTGMGEAYVAFSIRHPEEFVLLFTRGRSGRKTLKQAPPATSGYTLVLKAMQRGIESGKFKKPSSGSAEDLAYGFWALVHGMATLRATHLKGFKANFQRADRGAIDAFLKGLTA